MIETFLYYVFYYMDTLLRRASSRFIGLEANCFVEKSCDIHVHFNIMMLES